MTVRFWDRDLDQCPRPANSSGLRPSFDPENAPDPEMLDWRCRPALDRDTYDLLRDERALDPFDEGAPGALPREDLQDLAAGAAGASRVSSLSSAREAAPSQQQPGRGRDRAA